MQTISDYELELMKIIWANDGHAMYSEIVDGLNAKGYDWTKNTIITLLSRLVEKEMLKTSKIGRRNKYIALVSEGAYQSEQTVNFLNKIFEGNTNGLVSTLIEQELIGEKEYESLQKYWKEIKRA